MAIEHQEERRVSGGVQPTGYSSGVEAVSSTISHLPRFYSVPQVARLLGMAPVTVYRAIRAGEFPAVQVRGRLIVPAKAIDAMVDAAVEGGGLVDAAAWVPGGVA